jgi:hypothetical protein
MRSVLAASAMVVVPFVVAYAQTSRSTGSLGPRLMPKTRSEAPHSSGLVHIERALRQERQDNLKKETARAPLSMTRLLEALPST